MFDMQVLYHLNHSDSPQVEFLFVF
jgi:hypothetical protein